MIKKSLLIITAFVFAGTLLSPSYAFDVNSFNMTLQNSEIDDFALYDIIKMTFSLFNGDTQDTTISGHSMLYLNDTMAHNWEYSSYVDLGTYSPQDCPESDVVILSNSSSIINLCFLVPNDSDLGFSLIINDNQYFKDENTKEFILEYVPDWFKTTADLWCSDSITDTEYFNSIQFLISDGTIKVLETISASPNSDPLPSWIKSDACSWSSNQISDYSYLEGIYWLIDDGKIQL